MCDKYNGWSNYETWNFALWYDGCWEDDAIEALNNAEPQYDWETKKSCAIYDLAEYLERYVDDDVESVMNETSGMYADLLGAAIDKIDFREVAEVEIDAVYDSWLESQTDNKENENE